MDRPTSSAPTATLPPEARRCVEEQRLGFVATVRKDGSPSVSPKGTVLVWDERTLVFADLASPGTVQNLESDPRVEVNVVDPIARRGWRFRGTGRVVRTGPEFERATAFFSEQHLEDAPKRIRSVVLISVDRATPLVSPAYSTGASEKEVRRRSWTRFQELYAARPTEPGSP